LKLLNVILAFILVQTSYGQPPLGLAWSELDSYLDNQGKIILTDTLASNRADAAKNITSAFETYLSDKNTFSKKFVISKFFSILYPADSSLAYNTLKAGILHLLTVHTKIMRKVPTMMS